MTIPVVITKIDAAIIYGMADGKTDAMVAGELDMQISTMRNHKRVLMAKVGAVNTANLVAIGFRNHIIEYPTRINETMKEII